MTWNRRRRRHGRGGGDAEDKSASPPKGWSAIEDYMASHDEEWIENFADDIDTMLVFAGLFSAVVTAFVAVALTTLQPDNDQIAVQLLSVLVLRSGGLSSSDSFLNDTASSLPSSSSFQAPPSAVAINALWFTSLIFSLASALFGILAKQWCKDYLKWSSVVDPARENVLVRQMRYEAWQDWNVDAVIASLPALLEAALVLFVIGMVIFVWALENVVAAILTAVIVILLGTALYFTVLPVFKEQCPYRSPTSWAFTKLSYFLRLRRSGSRKSPDNWRERELHALVNAGVPSWQTSDLVSECYWEEVCRDGLQVAILLRALAWAHRGSGEGPLADDIAECMLSTHTNGISAGDSQVASTLRALQSMSSADIDFSTIVADWIDPLCERRSRANALHDSFPHYMFKHSLGEPVQLAAPQLPSIFVNSARITRVHDTIQDHVWITCRLLQQDLLDLATTWTIRMDGSQAPGAELSGVGPGYAYQYGLLSKQMVLAICFLRAYGHLLPGSVEQDFVDTLSALYRRLAYDTLLHQIGIIPMITHLLCISGDVKCDLNNQIVDVSVSHSPDPSAYLSHQLAFAYDIWEQNPEYHRINERHLFVMSVDHALQTVDPIRTLPISRQTLYAIHKMFATMLNAAQLSLINRYMNCGSYIDLPWLTTLTAALDGEVNVKLKDGPYSGFTWAVPLLRKAEEIQVFVDLLSALHESLKEGLITGTKAQEEFAELLRVASKSPKFPAWNVDFEGRLSFVPFTSGKLPGPNPRRGGQLLEAKAPHALDERDSGPDDALQMKPTNRALDVGDDIDPNALSTPENKTSPVEPAAHSGQNRQDKHSPITTIPPLVDAVAPSAQPTHDVSSLSDDSVLQVPNQLISTRPLGSTTYTEALEHTVETRRSPK